MGSSAPWRSSTGRERMLQTSSPASAARLAGITALAREAAPFRAVAETLDARRTLVLGEAVAGGRAYLYASLVAGGSRSVCVVLPHRNPGRRWRAPLAGLL